MIRLPAGWLHNITVKNNKAPSVQGKFPVQEEPFYMYFEKRKTHDIQAALLHSHRHVFSAEKRKKGRKANGNELFFSFTCLSLMVQIIACV